MAQVQLCYEAVGVVSLVVAFTKKPSWMFVVNRFCDQLGFQSPESHLLFSDGQQWFKLGQPYNRHHCPGKADGNSNDQGNC